METKPELACRLTSPDLAQRLDQLRTGLFAQVETVTWDETRAEFTFSQTDSMVDALLDFVRGERLCCPFLTYTLTLPADEPHARLRLASNTPEGGVFIRQTFGTLIPKGHSQ